MFFSTQVFAQQCETPDKVLKEMTEQHDAIDKIEIMNKFEYYGFRKYVNDNTNMNLPKADFAQVYYSKFKDEPVWLYVYEKNCSIGNGPIPKLLMVEYLEFNEI